MTDRIPLPPAALIALLEVLHDATGMDIPEGRSAGIASLIRDRMHALGIADWTRFRDRLTTDRAEMARLIEGVAVNETFFFRHPQQFDGLRRAVLPGLAATARDTGRPLRLWSAGCASGCEPYSLAIMCLEAASWLGPFPFEVIGSDVDAHALEEASTGLYPERAVTLDMPPEFLQRYFEKPQPNRWKISSAVSKHVRFLPLNLATDVYPSDCDIIFCRNVLYYFSEHARSAILRRLWKSLAPHRFLVLSPTEPVSGHESYFLPHPAAPSINKAWTTDRRSRASGFAMPGGERRRATASAEISGSEDKVTLAGGVGAGTRAEILRQEFSSALGRVRGESMRLDCTRLKWISNEALHELQACLLAAQKARKLRCAEAQFSNEEQKEWFRAAGMGRLIRRMELASPANATPPPAPLPALRPRPVARTARPSPPTSALAAAPPPTARSPRKPSTPHKREACVVLPEHADESAEASVREQFLSALAIRSGEIRVDFSACRYLSESVLRTLSRAISSRPDGSRVVLRGASPAVRRALKRFLHDDPALTWMEPAAAGVAAWGNAR